MKNPALDPPLVMPLYAEGHLRIRVLILNEVTVSTYTHLIV